MDEYESLSNTKWDCKYHVVFIPKCRRRTLYGGLRPHLGEVFKKLANPTMATRLPELMTIAGQDVLTDLSPVDLGALMTAMATTKLSSTRLSGTPYWHEDISYWLPDVNPNRELYRSQEQQPF